MLNKIFTTVLGILIVLLVSIGISYAYFTANFTGGEEATTITVTGGKMNINYSGGAQINVANILPDNNPASIKTFTITGNSTTDINMEYQVSLVVETNTFSESALKYKLISNNTDNNGTVIPNTGNLNNIGSGANNIILGTGLFVSPTNGNKIHTYKLEIYFLNAPYIQDDDKGKEIKAYIKVEN